MGDIEKHCEIHKFSCLTLSLFSSMIIIKPTLFLFLNGFVPLVIGFKTTMTLSRSFLNGALAIASIVTPLGFATSAQAISFTVDEIINAPAPGFSTQVGDKIFSGFIIPTGTGLFDLNDTVVISILNSGAFQVDFNGNASGSNLTASGSLSYNIAIDPAFTNTFTIAQQQTQGDNILGGSYVRSFTPSSLTPTSLVSIDGSSPGNGTFAPGTTSISVEDTWTITSPASINSFSDRYVQDPAFPQSTTPEPSAVLSLLALGLCGTLVSRRKV